MGRDRRALPRIGAGPGRVREDGGGGRAARVPLSGMRPMDAAIAAAREAGEVLLGHFGRLDPARVEEKSKNDVVSIADRESEAVIRRVLLGAFPVDRFLGEETGLTGADETAPSWIVDPLDGTANFVRGFPHWAVSIARTRGGLLGGEEILLDGIPHDAGLESAEEAAP